MQPFINFLLKYKQRVPYKGMMKEGVKFL